MSGSETIDRVIAAITYGARHGCPTPITLLMPGPQVARRLFELNATAHAERYPRRYEDERTFPAKPVVQPVQASEMQLFKSLQFYLYQCSEGDVPESPLFKELAAIRDWYGARVGYRPESDTWEAAKMGAWNPWQSSIAERAYNAAEWG